jgi:hypothetical protein
MMRNLGHDVVLFDVTFFDPPGRHMAVGLAGADNLEGSCLLDHQTGKKYFYCEATPGAGDHTTKTSAAFQWRIGDGPPASEAKVEIVRLEDAG